VDQNVSAGRLKPYAVVFGLPIGVPQVFAGILLLAFFAECLWISIRTPLRANEIAQIQQGQLWLAHRSEEADARSVLVPLLAAISVIGDGPNFADSSDSMTFRPTPRSWRWRARLPFVLIGLLLGASLWYVSRRLFGNPGGFIALTLYVFTPPLLQRSATVQPSIIAAWGAFGVIFTSIAVSHTLYAPREVVLWNWKRIMLLGVSLALSIAAQPALVLLAPVGLAYLLYLVPERRRASLIIFAAACALALVLLFALYRFHPADLASTFTGFGWREFSPALFARALTWSLLAIFFFRMPGVMLLLMLALIAYAAWKRPRYFGPTAALIVWALLMIAGVALPHFGGYNLFLVSLAFAYVFIAGVSADLLETHQAGLVVGVLAGMILAHAMFSVLGLSRM